MSIHKIVARSLMSAFVLSITGLAAARQPPALVRAQAATEYAVACQDARPAASAGYRDVLARTHTATPSAAVAKAGAGYRDIHARSHVAASPVQFACVTPPQLTASR